MNTCYGAIASRSRIGRRGINVWIRDIISGHPPTIPRALRPTRACGTGCQGGVREGFVLGDHLGRDLFCSLLTIVHWPLRPVRARRLSLVTPCPVPLLCIAASSPESGWLNTQHANPGQSVVSSSH